MGEWDRGQGPGIAGRSTNLFVPVGAMTRGRQRRSTACFRCPIWVIAASPCTCRRCCGWSIVTVRSLSVNQYAESPESTHRPIYRGDHRRPLDQFTEPSSNGSDAAGVNVTSAGRNPVTPQLLTEMLSRARVDPHEPGKTDSAIPDPAGDPTSQPGGKSSSVSSNSVLTPLIGVLGGGVDSSTTMLRSRQPPRRSRRIPAVPIFQA